MTDLIRAPWTSEQVQALNDFQQRGGMHPFTCGGDHWIASPHLEARADGWHCPDDDCDYEQDWAHAFMADPTKWPKRCSCGGRFPIHHLHADVHEPVDEPARTTPNNPAASAFPAVHGRCPACGNATLFLGDGGYVTCSLIGCPRPDLVNEVIGEIGDARNHAAYTFCAQLVGHVNMTAFARKISEKRIALGQRDEANDYAIGQKQRAEAAEAALRAILTAPDRPSHCHDQPAIWDGGGPCQYCAAILHAQALAAEPTP